MTVRKHDTSTDVVSDFSQACGVNLQALSSRVLERSEPAEILLRAAFNNRHGTEVHPDRFNNLILQKRQNVPDLKALTSLCFDHDGLSEIVNSKASLFEEIRDRLGPEFDFLSKASSPKPQPDATELNRRLVDLLVEITFQQAERIKKLEIQMQELEKNR